MLQERGRVKCVRNESHTWVLTAEGAKAVRTMARLQDGQLALRPRPSVTVRDMSLFELMYTLHEEGWKCIVAAAGRRKKKGKQKEKKKDNDDDSDMPTHDQPYQSGGAKVWWLKHNAKTVFASYLRCLLAARRLGVPIPHFQIERWHPVVFIY